MRRLEAFDLDHTLLNTNSSYAFSQYLYRQNVFSFADRLYCLFIYVYYNLFGISLEELHARVFQKLFAKKPLALFEKEIEPFLEENLQSLLNLPIVERLKKAQEEGHLCAIFSSSPSFLVGPIAKRLNVEEWFSSEYEIDKDRRLCKIKILMDGKKKARLLQELAQKNAFSKENLYCYSDSVEDLPFLLVAGHAIAINPDRKLKKIAKKNGWEIL